MDYKRLFDTVRRHLEGLGGGCKVAAGNVASEHAVAKFEGRMRVRLPTELREFYQSVADGFSFRWEADPNDSKAPFASLQVPTLKYLGSMYTGWRKTALYSPAES